MERFVLPVPSSLEDFLSRVSRDPKEFDTRKTLFLKKTIESYERSRELYFQYIRKVYFLSTIGEEKTKELFGDDCFKICDAVYPNQAFAKTDFLNSMKRIVISLRKLAECEYFLGLFDESLKICSIIFEIVEKEQMSKKMLKLTYAVMAKVMIEKKEYYEAWKNVEKGLEIDPNSGILGEIDEYFRKIIEYFCTKNGEKMLKKVEETPRLRFYNTSGNFDENFANTREVNDYKSTIDLLNQKGLFRNEDIPNEVKEWTNKNFYYNLNKSNIGYKRMELLPIYITSPLINNFVDDLINERIEYVLENDVISEMTKEFYIKICWREEGKTLIWRSLFV